MDPRVWSMNPRKWNTKSWSMDPWALSMNPKKGNQRS